MIWLTELEQNDTELTITGRSTTLISLSDFVGNLGTNEQLLRKPIEIVSSQVESVTGAGTDPGAQVELISFTVKAQIATRPEAKPAGALAQVAAVAR
jgi:hypothetical protein